MLPSPAPGATVQAAAFVQLVRLTGSFRCWFMKKYCWLVCVREKYCLAYKFMIVYDKTQSKEQAKLIW